MLVVGVYLLAELVDELVKAEVDLRLHLVVEELLAEDCQGVVRAVVVQVQRVEHALHVGGVLGLQDVVGQYPGHGHLDRELDPRPHRHLQVELAVPQLGEVAAVLQASYGMQKESRYQLANSHPEASNKFS